MALATNSTASITTTSLFPIGSDDPATIDICNQALVRCDTAPQANSALCYSSFSVCLVSGTTAVAAATTTSGGGVSTTAATTTTGATTAAFTGGANTLSGGYAGVLAVGGVLALL